MCAGHVSLCAALWLFLLIILVTGSILTKNNSPLPWKGKKKRSRLPYFRINHVIYNPDKLFRNCKKQFLDTYWWLLHVFDLPHISDDCITWRQTHDYCILLPFYPRPNRLSPRTVCWQCQRAQCQYACQIWHECWHITPSFVPTFEQHTSIQIMSVEFSNTWVIRLSNKNRC